MTILVPPTIVDGRSSNDLVVREKDRVNLTCEATGYPRPQILWRREDGKHIMASGVGSDKGEFLKSLLDFENFNSISNFHKYFIQNPVTVVGAPIPEIIKHQKRNESSQEFAP